jgi:uncharacterized protein
MKNAFVHIELTTGDLDRAKEFYAQLFSWKLEDLDQGPGGTYTMIRPGKGPGGGMMRRPMPEAPTAWTVYVAVDDLGATIDKARSLGATIAVERHEVPGMGQFGVFVDPTGAMLAVWEAARREKASAKKARKAAKKSAKRAKKKAKKGR